MFFIAYTVKGQVHVFAGQDKILSHSSCRTSALLKYFCPLVVILIKQLIQKPLYRVFFTSYFIFTAHFLDEDMFLMLQSVVVSVNFLSPILEIKDILFSMCS